MERTTGETESEDYQHIVVALDGSKLAEGVLPYVRSLARRFDSKITLVQVISVLGMPVPDRWQHDLTPVIEALHEEAIEYLNGVATRLREAGLTVDFEAPEGEPATVIVRRTHDLGANLIALTSIGRTGISRVIFGSVADKVLKTAQTPILLVRADEQTS